MNGGMRLTGGSGKRGFWFGILVAMEELLVRELCFIKSDVSRGINTISSGIQAQISTLRERVSYEYTRRGALLKFVWRIRSEPRITQAPKSSELAIVRWGLKQFLVRGQVVENRGGHAVDQEYRSGKCFRPER